MADSTLIQTLFSEIAHLFEWLDLGLFFIFRSGLFVISVICLVQFLYRHISSLFTRPIKATPNK